MSDGIYEGSGSLSEQKSVFINNQMDLLADLAHDIRIQEYKIEMQQQTAKVHAKAFSKPKIRAYPVLTTSKELQEKIAKMVAPMYYDVDSAIAGGLEEGDVYWDRDKQLNMIGFFNPDHLRWLIMQQEIALGAPQFYITDPSRVGMIEYHVGFDPYDLDDNLEDKEPDVYKHDPVKKITERVIPKEEKKKKKRSFYEAIRQWMNPPETKPTHFVRYYNGELQVSDTPVQLDRQITLQSEEPGE